MRRLILVLLCAAFLPLPARADEKAALTLVLNGEARGDAFVVLVGDTDVLLPLENWQELGFAPAAPAFAVEGRDYVSLQAASAQVRFRVDDRELKLFLDAPPEAFLPHRVNLAAPNRRDPLHPQAASFFLNYGAQYDYAEASDSGVWNLSHEAALHQGGWLLDTEGTWRSGGTSPGYQRLSTNLTRDDPQSLLRWTLGDLSASAGDLGGSAFLGGVMLSRQFVLDPFFLRTSGFSLEGRVLQNATVEVWRGAQLVATQKVGPGPFLLENLPLIDGVGYLTVVVRDALGREERREIPFARWGTLLAPGVNDFSLAAGAVRKRMGEENWDYSGGPALLARWERGLAPLLTLGAGLGVGEDGGAASALLRLGLRGLGLFNLSGGGSRWQQGNDPAREGFTLRASFSGQVETLRLGYSLQWQGWTSGFAAFGEATLTRTTRSQTAVSLNTGVGPEARWGSLSLGVSQREPFAGDTVRALSLRYTCALGHGVTLDLSGSRDFSPDSSWQARAELSASLGTQGRGAAFAAAGDDGIVRSGVDLGWNRGGRDGWGGGLRTGWSDDGASSYTGDLSWGGSVLEMRSRLDHQSGTSSGGISLAGSIAEAGGDWHLTRPIRDGFAVVKVASLEGVSVTADGRDPRTGADGTLILPYLRSGGANTLRISLNDLPLTIEALKQELAVAVPWKGGIFLDWPVRKVQAIQGILHVPDAQGMIGPARGWAIRIPRAEGEETVPVVEDGVFYLENLEAGSHHVKGVYGDRVVAFDLEIPASDESIIDLGKITLGWF